jgi:hypothetical protein
MLDHLKVQGSVDDLVSETNPPELWGDIHSQRSQPFQRVKEKERRRERTEEKNRKSEEVEEKNRRAEGIVLLFFEFLQGEALDLARWVERIPALPKGHRRWVVHEPR